MTGTDSFFSRRLIERWSESKPFLRVVRFDADEERLADVFREERVECLLLLADNDVPGVGSDRGRRDEAANTRTVFEACVKANVHRLVIPSTTMCYGPRLENPQYLTEDAELHGHPGAQWVSNRLQIEQLAARFRDEQPTREVTILRHCWIMGPSYQDAVVRYFDMDWVPTLLGHDPLMQFVHEDDVLDVLEAAVLRSHPGVFNVVGEGVLPVSAYLRLADKWNVPTPGRFLDFVSNAPVPLSGSRRGQGFAEYMKYIWVASGERAVREFGRRTFSSQEAWLAMIGTRRLHHYRTRN